MITEIFRWLLASIMVFAGVMHFRKPTPFAAIVPKYLPAPLTIVYLSGFFEICGGIGLLIPALSHVAAWGLVALFIAVFPANLNMAIHKLPLGDKRLSPTALWGRLPLQLVLIFWAWWFTRL